MQAIQLRSRKQLVEKQFDKSSSGGTSSMSGEYRDKAEKEDMKNNKATENNAEKLKNEKAKEQSNLKPCEPKISYPARFIINTQKRSINFINF